MPTNPLYLALNINSYSSFAINHIINFIATDSFQMLQVKAIEL